MVTLVTFTGLGNVQNTSEQTSSSHPELLGSTFLGAEQSQSKKALGYTFPSRFHEFHNENYKSKAMYEVVSKI